MEAAKTRADEAALSRLCHFSGSRETKLANWAFCFTVHVTMHAHSPVTFKAVKHPSLLSNWAYKASQQGGSQLTPRQQLLCWCAGPCAARWHTPQHSPLPG
jgi:hypothetical protein